MENWFFLIMDKTNDVFAAFHVVSEPGLDRNRYSGHIKVKGELYHYSNQQPFPTDFEMSPQLGAGKFSVRFVKVHQQIDLSIHDENLDMDISFLKRSPLFDYQDYDYSNPGKTTVAEIATLGTNQ